MEKYIYEFDVYGLYLGKKIAKVNPRNPNKILVPTSATDLEIPAYSPEHEVLIFNTDIPAIGDTSIAKCSWTIMNKKNLILDTNTYTYRHMTVEEQEEYTYTELIKEYKNSGIDIYGKIQGTTVFEPNYKYLDIHTSNVYRFTGGTVSDYDVMFPDKNFHNLSGDESLIVIFKEENGLVIEIETYAYNSVIFEKYFYNNITLLYPEFDEKIHKIYFTQIDDYSSMGSTVVFKNGILREASKEELISMKIVPPNDEPIWVKINNDWVIDSDKLMNRGKEILQKLHQYRLSKHAYFIFEVNGKTYNQRWSDSDKIYIEMMLRDFNSQKYTTINWRFNGTDPDAVEALTLQDANRMFSTGKIQELRYTTAQLLAAAIIKGRILSNYSTANIDYAREFDNQVNILKSIPDEEIEAFYNSI